MADPAARLAEIRARHDEYLRLKAADDGSEGSFWAVLAQAGHFAVEDVPLLLDALEAVLTLADRLDQDAAYHRDVASSPTGSEANGGMADAYANAATWLREALAAALNKEKTTDARS